MNKIFSFRERVVWIKGWIVKKWSAPPPQTPPAVWVLAWALPTPEPPLAAWVLAGWAPHPSKASSGCASPCGHTCGGLCPSWPVRPCVLWASFRSRYWWEKHMQRWGWHSRSRDLPRGLGVPTEETGIGCSSPWGGGKDTDSGGTGECFSFLFYYFLIFSYFLFF